MANFCGAGVSPAHAQGGNRDVQAESGFASSFAGKNGRRDACPTTLPANSHGELCGAGVSPAHEAHPMHAGRVRYKTARRLSWQALWRGRPACALRPIPCTRDACATRLPVGSRGELCGEGVSPAHAQGGKPGCAGGIRLRFQLCRENGRRDACPTTLPVSFRAGTAGPERTFGDDESLVAELTNDWLSSIFHGHRTATGCRCAWERGRGRIISLKI